MASTGLPLQAPSSAFYSNMLKTKSWKIEDLASGFRMTLDQFNELRGQLEHHVDEYKPPGSHFKGHNGPAKKRSAAEKVEARYPALRQGPTEWRIEAIAKLLGIIQTNRNRLKGNDSSPFRPTTPMPSSPNPDTLLHTPTPSSRPRTIAPAPAQAPVLRNNMWIEVKSPGANTGCINLPDILNPDGITVSEGKLQQKLKGRKSLLQKHDGSEVELVGTNALNYELGVHASRGIHFLTLIEMPPADLARPNHNRPPVPDSERGIPSIPGSGRSLILSSRRSTPLSREEGASDVAHTKSGDPRQKRHRRQTSVSSLDRAGSPLKRIRASSSASSHGDGASISSATVTGSNKDDDPLSTITGGSPLGAGSAPMDSPDEAMLDSDAAEPTAATTTTERVIDEQEQIPSAHTVAPVPSLATSNSDEAMLDPDAVEPTAATTTTERVIDEQEQIPSAHTVTPALPVATNNFDDKRLNGMPGQQPTREALSVPSNDAAGNKNTGKMPRNRHPTVHRPARNRPGNRTAESPILISSGSDDDDDDYPPKAQGTDTTFSTGIINADRDEDSLEDIPAHMSQGEHLSDDEDFDPEDLDEGDQAQNNEDKFRSKMFGQLDDMSAKLAHVTDDLVTKVTRYFPLISRQKFRRSADLEIPNWGLRPDFKISPYQLGFAVWAFEREQSLAPGGILADAAGSGKTIEMITLFLMGYYYGKMFDEVQHHRKHNLPGHLPANAPPGSKCPNAPKAPLACCCEPDNNDIYPLPPRAGVTITITPNAGLRSFQDDTVRMLEGGTILKHGNRPRIAIHASQWENHPITGKLTLDEMAEIVRKVDWSREVAYELKHRTFKVGSVPRTQPWLKPTFSGPVYKRRSPEEGGRWEMSTTEPTYKLPSSAAIGVMIVTTRQCYKNRVKEPFQVTRLSAWKWPTQRNTVRNDKTRQAHVVGRLMWDECHLDTQGKTMEQMVEDMKEDYLRACNRNLAMWGASGTPDNGNPFLFLGFLATALRSDEWDTPSNTKAQPNEELDVLRELTVENVKKSKTAFDKLCVIAKMDPEKASSNNTYAELVAFVRRVVPIFQIRRAADTRWFDGEVVIPKKCDLRREVLECNPSKDESEYIASLESDVKAEAERQFDSALREWERNPNHDPMKKPTKPNHARSESYYTARAAASVAQVVQEWKERNTDLGQHNCTRTNEIVARWIADPYGDEFRGITRGLPKTNAKMKMVFRYLDRIEGKTRTDGKRSKVILATRIPIVRACWESALEQRYGRKSFVVYGTGMSNSERSKAYDLFRDDETNWIILCTLKSMGVGMNLQRANYAFMLEPSYKLAEFQQFFARIDRRGQVSPICYGYTLHNTASRIEGRMVETLGWLRVMQDELYTKP